MKRTLLLFTVLITSISAYAQDPVYDTITGTIWRDLNSDGIRDAGENLLPGILVNLVDANTDSVYSVAITDTNGLFVLLNYKGTGDYYLDYYYPSAGFTVTMSRVGSDNALNSAGNTASPSGNANAIASSTFTISSNADRDTFGLGLVRVPTTITYWQARASEPTNWTSIFKFPKSDNSAGTLLKATIFTTDAAHHPTIGIENTGLAPEPAELDVSGRVTLTLPVGADLVTNTNTVKKTALGAYDGTTDYMGTSGFTWYNSFASNVNTRNVTAAGLLMNYRSSNPLDSISITAATTGASTIVGSGNLFANVSTNVGVGVYVTYTYTTALPVSLISFTANKKNKISLLNWAAISTPDVQGFVIERSTDGTNFSEIGYATANTSNSGMANAYDFKDEHPVAGMNFYRLNINENGASRYSQTVALNFDGNNTVSVYPNPATTAVQVVTAGSVQIRLYNQLGQVITVPMTQNGGQALLDLSGVQGGVYTLEVVENGIATTQKLMIQ